MSQFTKLGIYLFSMTILTSSLVGCVAPLVVGGVAVTSATVMTDRRSTGSIVNDEVLESRVKYEITQVIGGKGHITVTSYDGKVLLTGEVLSDADRIKAQQVAQNSLEVQSVINELAVMHPSSMTTRLSDSMLATKVRSKLIATEKISLNQMKVTVDRGIVYLMGIVTKNESKIAAQTAATVSGVQKVVMCFSVLTDAEVKERLKNLQNN